MATNLQVITQVRDMLDEPTAGQWTDPQLRRWINDGAKDIARATHFLEASSDVAVTSGDATVSLPTTVLEIQHAYWISDAATDRIIPLAAAHFEAMDQVWGSWQNQHTGDPVVFAPRGISPSLKVYLYPIPSTDGTLRVFYAGIPAAIAEDTTDDAATSPIPEGWVDLLVLYVEHRALRKDRDPRWQEALALYQQNRDEFAQHDNLAVARTMVMDPRAGGVPAFIADFEYMD